MSKFDTVDEYNETMQEWGIALFGLTAAQLKRGIDESIATLSWPPEIAEFIALAKNASKGWQHRGQAYKLHQRALPKPVDRKVGREALQGLKAAL